VDYEDKKGRSIMVFDDATMEKQTPIDKNVCQGCYGGANCYYLTQNYSRIPTEAIRDSANLLNLFNQDRKNIRVFYYAFVGGDMPYDEFGDFSHARWDQPYGAIRVCRNRTNKFGLLR
jgi:hypothetical protein